MGLLLLCGFLLPALPAVPASFANPACPGAGDCPWNAVGTFPSTVSGLKDATDVAVDEADGDVYVVERDFHRVVYYPGAAAPGGNFDSPEFWGAREGTGASGRGFGEFDQPSGVTVDSAGSVWVAETNGNRVQKFTQDGDFLLALGSDQGGDDGELFFPADVAVDGSGNVYVADTGNGRIQKFDSDGNFLAKTAPGQFTPFLAPLGIATDGTHVYAIQTDFVNTSVKRFNASDLSVNDLVDDGSSELAPFNSVDVFGGDVYASSSSGTVHKFSGGIWTDHTLAGESAPTGIDVATVGGTDYVFLSDDATPHVERLTTAFGSETELAKPGDEQLFRATGVAVDGGGDVWAVEGDSLEDRHRIVRYDSTGAFVEDFGADGGSGASGNGLGEFDHPADIFAKSTDIYVADAQNGRIQHFDDTTDTWSELSEPAGGFDFPAGIAVDSSDNVYVADSSSGASKVWKWNGATWSDLLLPDQLEFEFATDIAVDGSDVYLSIGSFDTSRIMKLSGGVWTTVAGHGTADNQVRYPRSLTVANGHLLIADTDNERVLKLTTAGVFAAKWGSGSFPAICGGELTTPYGITASSDGNKVYVADQLGYKVSKFSLDGVENIPSCDLTAPAVNLATPAADAVNVPPAPSITGSAGPGEGDVTVRVLKRTGAALAEIRNFVATPDGGGDWAAPWGGGDLAGGEYRIKASQTDAAGNTGHSDDGSSDWGARKFTVGPPADSTAPIVNLQNPVDNSYTNSMRPAIDGTAGNLSSDNDLTFELNRWNGAAYVNHHNWTFAKPSGGTLFATQVPIDLSDGTYHLRVYQDDDAGNDNPQDSRSSRLFTVDTAAPAVNLANPVDNSTTTSKRPAISGTAGNADTDTGVSFELNKWNGSAYVNHHNWSVARPTSTAFSTTVPIDLAPGTYHLRASQFDEAGNSNTQDTRTSRLFTVKEPDPVSNPPKLAVTAPANGKVTNERQPTIGGTTDTPGSIKVELKRWNGATYVLVDNYVVNSSNGFWSVRVPVPLPDGTYNVFAYETNLAGQTSNSPASGFTVDTVAPSKPRITAPANNTKTGSQQPQFSGTADANAGTNTVTLQLQGYQNGKWVVLKSIEVPRSGGSWSFKPSDFKFTEGYFAAFVLQYDAAGNLAVSDGSQFQVDLNAKAPDNPGTNNNDCQKSLDYGPFHVEGGCIKREGLTWVSKADVEINGIHMEPSGGGAKVIFDPFNLRIAAEGKVKVVLGPANLCLEDPTHIISNECYQYTVGPFVLYEGSFDWSWQGKVKLSGDNPKFGIPAAGGVTLPQLPGLSGFNLPNVNVPGWGHIALPDFSKIKGADIGKLTLPSLNAPNVTLPEKYFGNFKFNLPELSIGSTGSNQFFGFPIQGRLGLRFADQGVYIDAALKLPSVLGGTTGDANFFVGTAGNLLVKNLRFFVGYAPLGPIGFRNIDISYSGPNQLWEGSADVELPVPGGLTVRAGAGFRDGQLVNAEAGFERNFALGSSGLFLYGGSVFFKTVPNKQVGGSIDLGLGPKIKGVSAVSIDSDFVYQFANPSYFHIKGEVFVVNVSLASGFVKIYGDGDIDFGGKVGKDFGHGFEVSASVKGWVQRTRFNVAGDGKVYLGDWFKLDGKVNVSHIGLGGCATMGGLFGPFTFGATYKWSGALNVMKDSCSLGAVKATKSTARVAGASQTITVPEGRDVYVAGFKGTGGAPDVTLTGPKGEKISTTGQSGLVDKRFAVIHLAEEGTTQVAIAKPTAGKWTVEVNEGSVPLEDILVTETLDAPKIKASVTGRGDGRALNYNVDVEQGERVAFVELGPDGGESPIGEVGEGSGKIRFTPMARAAGVRTVKALVMRDGVARFTDEKVATFKASAPGVPKAPRVVAKRKNGKKGDSLVSNWTKVSGASSYRVTIVLNGRKQLFETRKTKVKVGGLFDRSKGKVSVVAVNAVGKAGKAGKATVAAPKAKRVKKR